MPAAPRLPEHGDEDLGHPGCAAIPESRYPPVIRQLTDAYGPQRMIYGGGFGADATPHPYAAAFERARSLLDHLSIADQAKILGGNAVRLFGLA